MSEMPQVEQEARAQGWVPQEEYKGDPDKWVDAEKFVERGKEIAAIAVKKSKDLEEKLAEIEKARAEDKKTFAEFKKFQDDVIAKERENLENWKQNQLAEIRALKKEAAKEGDTAKIMELDDKKDEVVEIYEKEKEKQKPQEKETLESPEDDAVFKEWLKDNSWYKDDADLIAYANGYGQMIVGKYTGKTYLDKVTEKVKEMFPEKFENPNRNKSNSVEAGGGGKRTSGKTYDDLPSHAKKACDKFCKTIPGYTKEQYLKDVDWDAIMKEAENA